jgi:hypothetical protein
MTDTRSRSRQGEARLWRKILSASEYEAAELDQEQLESLACTFGWTRPPPDKPVRVSVVLGMAEALRRAVAKFGDRTQLPLANNVTP